MVVVLSGLTTVTVQTGLVARGTSTAIQGLSTKSVALPRATTFWSTKRMGSVPIVASPFSLLFRSMKRAR